jgi:hypothetical protein
MGSTQEVEMFRSRHVLALFAAASLLAGCPADTGSDPASAAASDPTSPPSASASNDPCQAAATCGDCAALVGCGFCVTTGQCLSGDSNGSTDGTCVGPSWDFTGDDCPAASTDSDGGDVQSATYASHRATGCVPTVPRGGEDTDDLCSDGIDNDCNGYTDCIDWHCSRNPSVTVCSTGDAGTPPPADAGTPPTPPPSSGPIGPSGGTVSLLHFGAFGDVRPAVNNGRTYPSAIISAVMTNFHDHSAQFAVASGDYMFATVASYVTSNVDALIAAERNYGGFIFHGMGNHECTGATASNCPNGNETPNVQEYMSRLNAGHSLPYFDWTIRTSLGDAHFISTAPNAWSTAQQTWLQGALAHRAAYTFVLAHEPPTGTAGPGSRAIEQVLATSPNPITLRLYGHTHEYHHITGNAVIDGNAGAPLAGTGGSGAYYGYAMIDQRSDGNIVFTAYQVGTPPMVVDTWVVTPSGAPTH